MCNCTKNVNEIYFKPLKKVSVGMKKEGVLTKYDETSAVILFLATNMINK